MRTFTIATILATLALAASVSTARASVPEDPWAIDWTATAATSHTPLPAWTWKVHFGAEGLATASLSLRREILEQEPPAASPRPRAIEYSPAYETRRKIHVYASVATVPIFVTQLILGQRLYNGPPSDTVRSAHRLMSVGLAGLFGVNTVTGAWNLWEGRNDPNHRRLRLAHGLLMLGADGGFLATGLLAPNHHGGGNWPLHRGIAIASIGVATASYLMMLLAR